MFDCLIYNMSLTSSQYSTTLNRKYQSTMQLQDIQNLCTISLLYETIRRYTTWLKKIRVHPIQQLHFREWSLIIKILAPDFSSFGFSDFNFHWKICNAVKFGTIQLCIYECLSLRSIIPLFSVFAKFLLFHKVVSN